MVAYHNDDPSGHLKVAKCGNAKCSDGNTLTTVNPRLVVGTSVTIGREGFPVISYGARLGTAIASQLNIYWCSNATCSSGSNQIIGSTAGVIETSIAIGADGEPVISYSDVKSLKVVKCVSPACISPSVVTVDVDSKFIGTYNSITIGNDGLPVISYSILGTNKALKVAKCGNAACSTGNTITTIASPGFWASASITIATDGFPQVSYIDAEQRLKVVKCGNAACSTQNAITTIATADASSAVL